MLDIKRIRQNPQELTTAMARRHTNVNVDEFLSLDQQRRELLTQSEHLKNKRNETSALIPKLKKEKQDVAPLMEEMRVVGARIKAFDQELAAIDEQLQSLLLSIPNIPSQRVNEGRDEKDNLPQRFFSEPRAFAWEPKAHWDIGADLGILDFETAAKVTGARFTFYRGLGAKLERALISFMLDTHVENGYEEIFPPFIANRASMQGTGQLPKFSEDMFKLEGLDYYLIPTAEVPVTNMHRDSILDAGQLPLQYTAYSACFRAEAGSAGRDTRGLIRQHQFNKVELVKFVKPETSYDHLEQLTQNAGLVLEKLGLPHRVVLLCTGDMSFSSAMTYDIEVWMPSYGRYVEISSCSNFEDFQARRANIRYRDENGRLQFVHTLNGSGLAVGRTVAAILENYQNGDGSVTIPQALRPYMGCDQIGRR